MALDSPRPSFMAYVDIPMPDLWFQSFGVHPDDFEQTCATILQLYRQSPVYLDDLARELELALRGEVLPPRTS